MKSPLGVVAASFCFESGVVAASGQTPVRPVLSGGLNLHYRVSTDCAESEELHHRGNAL